MADEKAQRKADRKRPTGRPRKRGPAKPPQSHKPAVGLLDPVHFKALASPLRVACLTILAERKASPKELSKELRAALPSVSYHVKVLQSSGLIKEIDRAQRRGAVEHYYEAVHPTVLPPDFWRKLPVGYRKAISTRILKEFLDDVIRTMEANRFQEDSASLSLTPLVVDPVGVEKIACLARDFDKALLDVQREASDRLKDRRGDSTASSSERPAPEGDDQAVSMTVFVANFESARSVEDDMTATSRVRW